jgi:transposase
VKSQKKHQQDHNHKISRQIVNFAVANCVGIIRMEDLTDIYSKPGEKSNIWVSSLAYW